MDIKRLLETGSSAPELDANHIDEMATRAIAYPQLQKPANQNNPWLRQILATAAAVIVLIAAGVNFYPATKANDASTEQAYEDVTDLVLYETLNDLS